MRLRRDNCRPPSNWRWIQIKTPKRSRSAIGSAAAGCRAAAWRVGGGRGGAPGDARAGASDGARRRAAVLHATHRERRVCEAFIRIMSKCKNALREKIVPSEDPRCGGGPRRRCQHHLSWGSPGVFPMWLSVPAESLRSDRLGEFWRGFHRCGGALWVIWQGWRAPNGLRKCGHSSFFALKDAQESGTGHSRLSLLCRVLAEGVSAPSARKAQNRLQNRVTEISVLQLLMALCSPPYESPELHWAA